MAWQDRSAWSLAVMPSFVAGTDLSHAVPRGAHPLLSSVSQDTPSSAGLAPGWLLAGTRSCCWLERGCSHMECGPSSSGTARLVREGRSKKLPCYLSMCTFTQALQLGAPGCLCTLGAPLQLPKKCLQGSGLQAAIS